MRFVAEPISDLRLQRFHRWALLWLSWFASFLDAAGAFAPLSKQAEAIGHLWLDRIERVIAAIVMVRAAPRVRALRTKRPFALQRLKQSALTRAVIGAKLRRALRPKQLRQRCDALRRIDIGALAARLLKRLPRGLTRRRPILTAREQGGVRLVHGVFGPTLTDDTS
ncbi:MAG: hypothetical protein WAU68_03110 [Vitreimonas sp.]